MRATLVLAVAMVLAASAAQASVVEDLAAQVCPGGTPLGPCVYQSDFGAPGDAPGTEAGVCVPSDRTLPFQAPQSALLVPVDDAADNVFLNIAPPQVGRMVTVVLAPSQLANLLDLLELRVFTPGCVAEVPGGGGLAVRFFPQQPGLHVVHVALRDLLPAPLAGEAAPGADACHPFCAGVLNPAAGYEVQAIG